MFAISRVVGELVCWSGLRYRELQGRIFGDQGWWVALGMKFWNRWDEDQRFQRESKWVRHGR